MRAPGHHLLVSIALAHRKASPRRVRNHDGSRLGQNSRHSAAHVVKKVETCVVVEWNLSLESE
jgi:hypothetical protein